MDLPICCSLKWLTSYNSKPGENRRHDFRVVNRTPKPFPYSYNVEFNASNADTEPAQSTQGIADESSNGPTLAGEDSHAATSHFYSLDPNYISVGRISGVIFFLVVLVASAIGLFGQFKIAGDSGLIFIAIASAIGLLNIYLLASAIVWPAVKYRHYRWRIDDVGLEIHRGVWWKTQISVPLSRVQHADVTQGPLQRSYGIGTLTIHTAGTLDASVDLPGLHHDIALQLRDRLIRQGIRGHESS